MQHMLLEQYLVLVTNSDRRYEIYDGEVSLLAGGSSNHAAIALNFGVALDQTPDDDVVCRPYVSDKLVRVNSTKIVIPDVVVSYDLADQGESHIINSPILVVEVLSKSTEMTDRFVKLALYQAKKSIQEMLYKPDYSAHRDLFSFSYRLALSAIWRRTKPPFGEPGY